MSLPPFLTYFASDTFAMSYMQYRQSSQQVKSARVGRGLPAALETDYVMGTATDSGCRTAPLACLGRAPHLGFAVDSMEQVPAVFRSAALQVPAELV